MESRARIIAVDDEPEIGAIVAEYLGKSGYAVRTVLSGAALDAELAREPADLVLLDVNMPGEDGFSVARRLRAGAPVRIIMVTAANEVIDRVVGLEIGADDYVAKPFNLRELQARVSAILRRPLRASPSPAVAAAEPPAPKVEGTRFGNMVLDNEGRALIAADGRRERLSEADFALLSAFARYPNRVLSREKLVAAIGAEADGGSRAVDIRITRLRRRVERNPAQPQVIKTVRGAGYIYTGFGDEA
ncbi:response regulator transcription factor [Mesorhizobium sp. LHD-90]|uniref:response regulator transcription factor n=1 Tax=Mesorhizobium sp. LHD-90 TaxID=3071414 RepID=UPI0027DF72E5|nr:response regulator transcription factor [Mesorhizobium sp. LHD-90]MDQ6437198.1 response regulator transcription factor [Mesorhizobium sp. LHD-90]